jgi:hypothetical protein
VPSTKAAHRPHRNDYSRRRYLRRRYARSSTSHRLSPPLFPTSPPPLPQANLCLLPKLRIAPTVTINRADVSCGGATRAAQRVIASLTAVRAAKYDKKGEPTHMAPAENEQRKGVVKLGFSWEERYAPRIGAVLRIGMAPRIGAGPRIRLKGGAHAHGTGRE